MKAVVRRIETLNDDNIHEMYGLFCQYFDGVSMALFHSDLMAKDRVVILMADNGSIIGFSTIITHDIQSGGQHIRVLFSGDTIIAHQHWGSQTFAFAWIREIARIKAEAPQIPLYWLLISKGYRTYRYLNAFALDFSPDWRGKHHRELDDLRNAIACQLFGADYDAKTGTISFSPPRGHLAPKWAHLSERELARPDVSFFVKSNPGYANGDELVCLCLLDRENMKPLTKRIFDRGMKECTTGI